VPDQPLRLLAPTTVRIGRATPRAGSWLTGAPRQVEGARERLGFGQPTHLDFPTSASFYTSERNLMPAQLWRLYRTTPDVRACVDSITRRIATWDWTVRPTVDPRDRARYDHLAKRCAEATAWLQRPNVNGETWQEVLTRTAIDLLVYDAGVLELNIERGELLELVPWLGSEWFPVYDEKNVLQGYRQEKEDGAAYPTGTTLGTVTVPPERLVYFSLFRNNREPLGVPLLDTLVNECITVLLASEHAMLALDADEIPPGLLVIGGVAGAAAERARADLQQMRGKDQRVRVISSPQPGGIKAEWLELRHSVKDVQLLEVVDQMRRAIWRVFGVMPVELGVGDSTPRALAEVQVDVSSSHLIAPILELLQARINTQVLPLLLGADAADCAFAFDRAQPLTPEQRLALARAQDSQVRRGIITVNEARTTLGLLPVDGGDVPVMDTNEGPRPLTQVVQGAPPAGGGGVDGGQPPSGGSAGDQQGAVELALADLSDKTQQLLRDKASTHNATVEERGLAEWRRTTARTLAVVYDRGIGAYNTNPESVRPVVTSAHQWAVARVNGWLHALLTDEFKRAPYDTDLLPSQHPHSTKGEQARAVVARVPDLPRAPLDTAWGWEAGAQAEVLGDPPSWQRYARAHLWRDPQRAGQPSGYRFPVARMVDGELQLVFRGAAAVVGALQRTGKHESLEGVSLSDQRAVYQRVRAIYEAFGQEPPTIDRLEAAQRSPACRQPGEATSDCVARKVPELVAEGYPQRQAVAIAASLCEQLCGEQRVAERYGHIDFTPPKGVVAELRKGLEWHEEGHSGDGLRPATVAWARRMANGADISPDKVRRMRAWLARHAVDKEAEGFRPGEEGYPSAGRVAWALWGGDPAVPWSGKLVGQLDAADEEAGIKREGQPAHPHSCTHDHAPAPAELAMALERLYGRAASWLPSDWPDADRFDGYRTIDLQALAEVVEDYGRAVTGLYRDASVELQAILLRAYGGDRVLDPAEAQRAQVQMLDRLDQLAGDWSVRTRPFYQRAAQLAVDSADTITGQPVDVRWRAGADAYHGQAMAYLTQPSGLVGTLQAQVRRLVSAATLGTRDRIDDLDPEDGPRRTTQTLAAELGAQAVRIDNWSGRLVGLANAQLVEALNSTVTPGPDGRPAEWMAEWVNAGGRSCDTCIEQGAQPIRTLAEIGIRPGEDTLCVGRCRCVLVFWTRTEVDGGQAVRLSALAPGGPDA